LNRSVRESESERKRERERGSSLPGVIGESNR
jgi:hypothetical protein